MQQMFIMKEAGRMPASLDKSKDDLASGRTRRGRATGGVR
jgi:hypothetical protein